MANDEQPRDFIERDRNSEIDEAARRLFEFALPPGWVVNPFLKNDYAKDYHVELTVPQTYKQKRKVRKTKKVTGKAVYVQLKGQQRADYRYDGSVVAQELTLRVLTYFADEARLPVFLVVADLESKKTYWLFLQEYLLNRQTWRQQATTTVHVPTTNDLSDIAAFEREIDRALEYMRLLRGATVRETVLAQVSRLEAKDTRFKVEPRITDASELYIFHPKEDVPFEFRFTGDASSVAFKTSRLIDKGLPVEVGPGEVVFTGSALFEEIAATGGTLSLGRSFEGAVTLICKDPSGHKLARWDEFPGKYEGGIAELRFSSNLKNSPVSVTLGPIGNRISGSIAICVNPIVWEGQRLLNTSYFDTVHKFFTSLVNNRRITLECRYEGNCFFKVTVNMNNTSNYAPFIDLLEGMAKGRNVARYFQIDPVCTKHNLSGSPALKDVEMAYAILFEDGWEERAPKMDITIACPSEEARKLDVAGKECDDLTLFNDMEDSWEFMGQPVKMGPLVTILTDATRKFSGAQLRQMIDGPPERVELRFSSSESSKYTLRKQTQQEIAKR